MPSQTDSPPCAGPEFALCALCSLRFFAQHKYRSASGRLENHVTANIAKFGCPDAMQRINTLHFCLRPCCSGLRANAAPEVHWPRRRRKPRLMVTLGGGEAGFGITYRVERQRRQARTRRARSGQSRFLRVSYQCLDGRSCVRFRSPSSASSAQSRSERIASTPSFWAFTRCSAVCRGNRPRNLSTNVFRHSQTCSPKYVCFSRTSSIS